jgi:hypothetical protein
VNENVLMQHSIQDAFPPQRLLIGFTLSEHDDPPGQTACSQRVNANFNASDLLSCSH